MRVHHLNCISSCPLGGWLMDGIAESAVQRGHLTNHCLQQWCTRDHWHVYNAWEGDTWFGLNCVRELDGISDEIYLVPLIGHTFGHAGVAVRGEEKWLFLTGDAYFFYREISIERPFCTPGLSLYQTMMEKDRKSRIWNQMRLRRLKKYYSSQIEIFCSHDVFEFERLTGRSPSIPVEKMRSFEEERAHRAPPSPEIT